MKKRKTTLALLLTFALLIMASSGASASVSSAEYWWDATSDNSEITVHSMTFDSDVISGNSFSLFSWEDSSRALLLLNPTTQTSTTNTPRGTRISVIKIGGAVSGYIEKDKSTGLYYAGIIDGPEILLGKTSRFGFSFSNSTGTYLDYDLEEIITGDNSWKLTGPTGMIANVQGGVAPSAVPLPGSVLLFGSGLLGLIGIRSRRKSKS